jgi:hypothetical protein
MAAERPGLEPQLGRGPVDLSWHWYPAARAPRRFLAAWYSAAASVAAATDAAARPVTSKAAGRKMRGPRTLSRAATSGSPPASVQNRPASSSSCCVMLTILDGTGPDNQR